MWYNEFTCRKWGIPLFPLDGGTMDICERIRTLIKEEVKALGYILDDVLYVKEEGQNFLRIVIDKEGMIDIDDCICVTKKINPIIDKEDPIDENYILDVCSKEKGCV